MRALPQGRANLVAPGARARRPKNKICGAVGSADAGATQIEARRSPLWKKAHPFEMRRLSDRQRRRQTTQAAGCRSLAREQPGLKVRTVYCAKKLESIPRRVDDPRPGIDDQKPRVDFAQDAENSVGRIGRHGRAGF